jgi:hypothetical protein
MVVSQCHFEADRAECRYEGSYILGGAIYPVDLTSWKLNSIRSILILSFHSYYWSVSSLHEAPKVVVEACSTLLPTAIFQVEIYVHRLAILALSVISLSSPGKYRNNISHLATTILAHFFY